MNKQGENGIPYCDFTWNPVTGCLHSCSYCFARRIAERFSTASKIGEVEKDYLLQTNKTYSNNPFPQGFKPTFYPNRLDEPIVHDKPSRIFVSDMGDLFGSWVPKEWIEDVLRAVRQCPQHTFLFLTKNPKRYLEFEFPENAWIGTSVENQAAADERIPLLLQASASVRFISVEPLLGAINLFNIGFNGIEPLSALGRCSYHTHLFKHECLCNSPRQAGINWVIAGGESGQGARPLHPDWARSLRDQCQAAGTKFFFKSWGDWLPNDQEYDCNPGGVDYEQRHKLVGNVAMCRVGNKKAGRLLDGQTWDEMPCPTKR